jgi:hypothetical protein
MRKVNYEHLTVNSEAIDVIEYFRELRTLMVRFSNGGVYSYYNIPVKLFQKMRNSYSIGKFYNRNIKNRYDFTAKHS